MNTLTITEIKSQQESKVSDVIKKCGVFFAFSNKQFEEGKTTLKEGEKYISIGLGGFMPKGNIESWQTSMNEIDQWFKSQTQASEQSRYDHIAYELINHEAYYTGDIQTTLDALGLGYTAEDVWKVFNSEKANHLDD